ncbi:MAG TPA: hypothetical protein VH082_03270 [Rudaea sp.]|jgi:hypothetical protein|nr:hypothetical protein [Rudaea sp.]
MYTFSFLRALALFLLTATAAFAQNFIDNPYFDSDIDYWQAYPSAEAGAQVTWTPRTDHFDTQESGIGGLQISAPNNESFAEQCVGIENDQLYIVSVWVHEQCAGAADLYVFWGNNDCVNDGKYDPIRVRATQIGEWERIQISGVAPHDRRRALVTLINVGGCATDPSAYFDGVNFLSDWIFKDSFESL